VSVTVGTTTAKRKLYKPERNRGMYSDRQISLHHSTKANAKAEIHNIHTHNFIDGAKKCKW
jgi:hypothetical protein